MPHSSRDGLLEEAHNPTGLIVRVTTTRAAVLLLAGRVDPGDERDVTTQRSLMLFRCPQVPQIGSGLSRFVQESARGDRVAEARADTIGPMEMASDEGLSHQGSRRRIDTLSPKAPKAVSIEQEIHDT